MEHPEKTHENPEDPVDSRHHHMIQIALRAHNHINHIYHISIIGIFDIFDIFDIL